MPSKNCLDWLKLDSRVGDKEICVPYVMYMRHCVFVQDIRGSNRQKTLL